MSLKKVKEVKSGKWFRPLDIVVYAAVIAIALSLILFFSFNTDKSELGGFYLSYKGEKIFEYDFESDKYTVYIEERVEVTADSGDTLTLRFKTEDGEYNDIKADKKQREVKVVAADCSTHKDCVYTEALKYNGSTPIVCTPHSLVISPLKVSDDGKIKT